MPPPVRAGLSPAPHIGVDYGRVRSASPARRALTLDMRKMANLLRDPPALGGDGGSINTSICSSPHSVMEPGDRGAAPVIASAGRLSGGVSRVAVQGQLSALADKMNATMSNLQWQCQEDRRRLVALERKLETRLEDRAGVGDAREKWADIQGKVNGLIEETQSLTRRVEGLDERLWARTSGTEASKQRSRELEQQVQTLEHQTRLTSAASEEAQKRHSAKIRRSEHAIEEAVRRLTKLEEHSRQGGQQRDSYLESRVASTEQQLAQLSMDMRDIQAQVDEGLMQAGSALGPAACGDVDDALTSNFEESIHGIERSLSTLDRRLTNQVEELATVVASMRVKVDGQLQRVSTLSERLETAHAPALESLRSELTNRIVQDRRELEGEMSLMRDRLQETSEGADELRESLRQAQAEVAALSLRQAPSAMSEEVQAIRNLDERCAIQEREVQDMRMRFEEMYALQQALGHDTWLDSQGNGLDDGADENPGGRGDPGALGEELEEALRASERNVSQLEKRLTGQIEELTSAQASLRVKVDTQLDRVSVLAERIEKAHEPAVESLRADIAQTRTQDRREFDMHLDSFKKALQELSESREEAPDGLRESLRTVRRQIEALSKSDESPILRVIDERCGVLEEDLRELRERTEEIASAVAEEARGAVGHAPPREPLVQQAASGGEVEEALAQSRQVCAELKDSVTAKVDDLTESLAKMRVKVDGQVTRIAALAERVEVAHAPALESLRSELAQLRQQDQQDLSAELLRLRSERAPADDEMSEPGRGGASAEALQALEARCDAQGDAMATLQKRLDALSGKTERGLQHDAALEELTGKVDAALEEIAEVREASAAASAPSSGKELDQLRDTVNELAEQIEQLETSVKECREQFSDEIRATREEMHAAGQAKSGGEDIAAQKELRELRDAVSKVTSRVTSLDGEMPQRIASEVANRVDDLREELREFKERTEEALEKASHEELQDQVDELRHEVEELSARAKERAEEAPAKATKSTELAGDEVRACLERVDLLEDAASEATKQVDGMVKRLESLQAEMKGLQASVDAKASAEQLAEAKAAAEGVARQLEGFKTQVEAVKEAATTPSTSEDPGLTKRLASLECLVDALGKPGGSQAAAAPVSAVDEQTRTKVQEEVEDLTQKLKEELASLSKHQQDILETKDSLGSLAAKVAASPATAQGAGGASEAALRSVTERLDAALQRLAAVEDASGAVRKDIEQLRGPRKVGISLAAESFSLEDARTRLELLSEQVTELQVARPAVGGGGGAGARGKLQAATPDASLNFSLTEQTDRPGRKGGADDSLGLSMTESKKDFSLTDSVPILSAPPQRRSGPSTAAAPGSLSGVSPAVGVGAGGGDDDSEGSFDLEDEVGSGGKPSDLLGGGSSASRRGLGDDGGDILDSLAKGLAVGPKRRDGLSGTGARSGADALDSLVGLSAGGSSGTEGRGRGKQTASGGDDSGGGHLARVDEETSDLGDQSAESRASRSGSKQSPASRSKSSAVGVHVPESPSASFSGGPECGMEVSMSCNEVSYCGDYSVEDSQELDKCDHVEEVKPLGPLQKQVVAAAAAASATASREGASAAQPRTTGVGGSSGATARPMASPLGQSQSRGEDDEYGDDFDEDNASNSVSEDIVPDEDADEDLSGSGSGD